MSLSIIILLAVIVILIVYVWSVYNSLATGGVRIQEALSEIDVQLKRRIDLIPNLIETVKGYEKHEKAVFENVTKARQSLMGANNVQDKAKSNNMLSDALKSLLAISENYPNLRASENFIQLQQELSDTENKIAYARQFYNSTVQSYNTTLVNFPGNIFGNMFGYKPSVFFQASESEKEPVKVSF